MIHDCGSCDTLNYFPTHDHIHYTYTHTYTCIYIHIAHTENFPLRRCCYKWFIDACSFLFRKKSWKSWFAFLKTFSLNLYFVSVTFRRVAFSRHRLGSLSVTTGHSTILSIQCWRHSELRIFLLCSWKFPLQCVHYDKTWKQ